MMVVLEAVHPQGVKAFVVEDGVVRKARGSEKKGETLRLAAGLIGRAPGPALSGIVAAMSGGTFSHIRSVAATANALGFAFGVPVLGVRSAVPRTPSGLRSLERRVGRLRKTAIATPAYSGEPNITVRRDEL